MSFELPTIVVTGANGFLASNLILRLKEEGHSISPITRQLSLENTERALAGAGIIFHLAGANGADRESEFFRSNRDYTAFLSAAVAKGGKRPLIVYSSSAKATDDSSYGRSKRAGEEVLLDLAANDLATVSIWRLPNLCGKWSRPNYNSVVATFCHNAARGLPLQIDDAKAPLSLLYVDDLIDEWLELIASPPQRSGFAEAHNVHQLSVGKLADIIQTFAEGRAHGVVGDVATGLSRALYVSFIAALPVEQVSYALASHDDARGSYVELLKTRSSGQFSYFTARPGATRGGHYHHSKVEKFVVAHGTGRFRFRHVVTGDAFELVSSAGKPLMIETIPGWAHDVTNIGDDELIVLSWANEQFDPDRPDTFPLPL